MTPGLAQCQFAETMPYVYFTFLFVGSTSIVFLSIMRFFRHRIQEDLYVYMQVTTEAVSLISCAVAIVSILAGVIGKVFFC